MEKTTLSDDLEMALYTAVARRDGFRRLVQRTQEEARRHTKEAIVDWLHLFVTSPVGRMVLSLLNEDADAFAHLCTIEDSSGLGGLDECYIFTSEGVCLRHNGKNTLVGSELMAKKMVIHTIGLETVVENLRNLLVALDKAAVEVPSPEGVSSEVACPPGVSIATIEGKQFFFPIGACFGRTTIGGKPAVVALSCSGREGYGKVIARGKLEVAKMLLKESQYGKFHDGTPYVG